MEPQVINNFVKKTPHWKKLKNKFLLHKLNQSILKTINNLQIKIMTNLYKKNT